MKPAQVRLLLSALRLGGGGEAADAFVQRFAARDWRLSARDVAELLAALSASSKVEPTPEPAETAVVPALAPLRELGPFVDALGGAPRLLAVDQLAGSSSFAALRDAARSLFVEALGFDDLVLDETARLGSQTTLQAVQSIARFDDVFVCVVQLRANWNYANIYAPVFRLHPRALLVAIDADAEAIRVVCRPPGAATPQYRVLRGSVHDGVWNYDDLVVWMRRFEHLRPRFSDDGRTLTRRVVEALGIEGAAFEFEATIDASQTGLSWAAAAEVEVASFLQADVDRRLNWGLEAALRAGFPLRVSKGTGRVSYRSHRVCQPTESSLAALQQGTSRCAEGVLELTLTVDNGVTHDFELPFVIPVPDADGIFVIDGEGWRFEPRIDSSGQPVDVYSTRAVDAEQDVPDDEAEQADGDASKPHDAEAKAPRFSRVQETRLDGASIRGLLDRAVRRKLAGIAATVWWLSAGELESVRHLRAALSRFFDAKSRLVLTAGVFVRDVLDPADVTDLQRRPRALLETESSAARRVPEWACVDTAVHEDVGRWVPVAGACLGPCGRLYIPISQPSKTAGHSLKKASRSAHDCNPRLGASNPLPREWWTAPSLQPWATLSPGQIEGLPGRRPVTLECAAVEVRGARRRAWLAPSLVARSPELIRHHAIDIPAIAQAPGLRVRVGDRVKAGEAWLEVPNSSWPGATPRAPSLVERAACRLAERSPDLASGHVCRVPPGLEGVVVDARITELFDRRGHGRAYRAWLAVARPPKLEGDLLLPDGRIFRIAGALHPADRPQKLLACDVVLEDPEAGADGELALGAGAGSATPRGDAGCQRRGIRVDGSIVWLRDVIETASDDDLRWRWLDGEGIAAHRQSPQHTAGQRLWTSMISPDVGTRIAERSAAPWSGVPPAWVRLRRLVEVASEPGDAAGRAAGHAPPDPVRTRAERAPPVETLDDPMWRCHCGAVEGFERALETCRTCMQAVTLRSDDTPSAAFRLPHAVLHPVHIPAAAALLGLSGDELRTLVASYGLSELPSLLREASTQPEDAAIRRLAGRACPPALGGGLLALRRLSHRGLPDVLWLHALRRPDALALPTGWPFGAPGPVRPPLIRAWRQLTHAAQVYRRSAGIEVLRASSEAGLQAAVDALFNADARAPHPALSDLVRAVWPLTRDPATAQVLPGEHRVRGQCLTAPEGSPTPATWAFEPHAPGMVVAQEMPGPPRSAIWTMTGEVVLPEVPRYPAQPCLPRYWVRRVALWTLYCQMLPKWVAVFAALELRPDPKSTIQPWRAIPPAPPPGPVGRGAAQIFARAISRADADPGALVELLTGPLPRMLPADSDEACARLIPVLAAALPGHDEETRWLRHLCVGILGGWWQVTRSASAPTGWTWRALGDAPVLGRRALPAFCSSAWSAWPTMDAAESPLTWLLANPDPHVWPPTLRAAVGWPAAAPELSAWAPPDVAPVSPSRPAASDAVVEPPTPKPAIEQDTPSEVGAQGIRVLTGSAGDWLQRMRISEERT